MSRVITFSRFFPAKHPRKGEPTYFVEKMLKSLMNVPSIANDDTVYSEYWCELVEMGVIGFQGIESIEPKYHTIRAGNRWKVGDKFSPRVWSGKPYASKQIIIAPDIEIKKIFDIIITPSFGIFINKKSTSFDLEKQLCSNDGLSWLDFTAWFYNHPKMNIEGFKGQILCWNEKIEY